MAKKVYIERITFTEKDMKSKAPEGHRSTEKGKGAYDSKKSTDKRKN